MSLSVQHVMMLDSMSSSGAACHCQYSMSSSGPGMEYALFWLELVLLFLSDDVCAFTCVYMYIHTCMVFLY